MTIDEMQQSQTPFVVADATGKIVSWGVIPQSMLELQPAPAGGSVVPGTGMPDTFYVEEGEVLARPANPTVLDGMTLRSLPSPCTITLKGQTHECTDDHCELSFSQPGTYPVQVSAWPMLDATFEVTQA